MRIELYGLKILQNIDSNAGLSKLIVEEVEKQAYGIRDGDVIVITSKIVSKVEGRIFKLSEVRPSRKAIILSRIYKRMLGEIELILRNRRMYR